MTDSYTYSPNPVQYNQTFSLTYTASLILAPFSNYDLLTVDNKILSFFNPIYTFCKGTGVCDPSGVDLDSSGNLYIVNGKNNSIILLDTSTNTTQCILRGLSTPSNIYFDRTNHRFYLILQGNGTTNAGSVARYIYQTSNWILDPSFTTITSINNPQDLTLGNNNILYVSNTKHSNQKDQISTYNLTNSTQIAESIINNLKFPKTLSFDFSNNHLFFSNYDNGTTLYAIGRANVDASGNTSSVIDNWSTGHQDVHYSYFYDQYLYICDASNGVTVNNISKIDSNGTHTHIQSNLQNLSGIAVNANGIYYSSNTFQINKLVNSTTTNLVNSITGLNGPAGITMVTDLSFVTADTFFVVNNFNKSISAVHMNGSVSEFVSNASGGFISPLEITYARPYLYVTDTLNNKVSKIDKYGTVTVLSTTFTKPSAITYNSTFGLLYVSESTANGDFITTYNPTTNARTILIQDTSGLQVVNGICFDASNTLSICNNVTSGFISQARLDTSGTSVTQFILNYQTQNLVNPAGVISDNLNNLFIVNDYGSSNGVISVSAKNPSIIVPTPPPEIPTIFGNSVLFQNPFGITFDGSGNLFNTNLDSFSILKSNTHDLHFLDIPGNLLNANQFNSLYINDPFNLIDIDVYMTDGFVCFHEDSKILTSRGYVPIKYLKKGDLIKTALNGYVPLHTIAYKDIYHTANKERVKDQLYKCTPQKYPELHEDLIITGCHSILVDDFTGTQREDTEKILGKIYITGNKYRLPACVDAKAEIYDKKGYYRIYHFALENANYYHNYGVYANGLLVETCSKRYINEVSNMVVITEDVY